MREDWQLVPLGDHTYKSVACWSNFEAVEDKFLRPPVRPENIEQIKSCEAIVICNKAPLELVLIIARLSKAQLFIREGDKIRSFG